MSTWGASPTPPNMEAIKRENENLQSQVQLLTSELTTLKLSSVSMWCTGGREGLVFVDRCLKLLLACNDVRVRVH